MEDPEMGLLLGTVLVFGLANFWGSSLLEWIFKKITPQYMASLGHVATTVAVVSVTTAVFMFVSTRRFIVGPYEQWTFENIGGQLIAGVLVVGLKIWMGSGEVESSHSNASEAESEASPPD